MLQQQPSASFMSIEACKVERCHTMQVGRAYVGTMPLKQPSASFVAIEACKVERCATYLVDCTDVGAMLQK